MGVFDSAKIVKINNKEVESIKTNDGGIIYQRPTAIITGNSLTLGIENLQWLNTTGNVAINWGDGSANTVNNPTTALNHTYTDGKQSHGIVFIGKITGFGESCFDNCTGLTSVIIPNSVTSIKANCFYNCTALVNYHLYWTNNNIITYNSNKMPNNTNTKFYVPKGQKTNYVNKGYPSDKVVERIS